MFYLSPTHNVSLLKQLALHWCKNTGGVSPGPVPSGFVLHCLQAWLSRQDFSISTPTQAKVKCWTSKGPTHL